MSHIRGAALNLRTIQRQLSTLVPGARPAGAGESTVDPLFLGNDAPRLISATVVEEDALRARPVAEGVGPGFRAFLDGTQRSHVAAFIGAAPIILGHGAAVIRERREQRMHTWSAPLMEARVYAPRAFVSHTAWMSLSAEYGPLLVDTTDGAGEVLAHPLALRDAAVHRLQAHREALEQQLAERWCATEQDPLFVDGGISGGVAMATSDAAVGVVKTHRTFYAEGDALAVVLRLGVRERSSVFRITSPKRSTVASWYLRLRDPDGHDPMWGLVRVEVRNPLPHDVRHIGSRAEEVSRWILAEASPLSLPDARWDRLVYGIRDCEEFLRAVQ